MYITNFSSKIMLTVLTFMGFLTVHGTVAMEAETPLVGNDAGEGQDNPMQGDEGQTDPAQIADVEAKVEGMALEQFHMPSGALPKEVLAAIFVNLDPEELVIAASVNKEWRAVAVRVMMGNLAKMGIPQFATATDDQIISDYSKIARPSYFNKMCPKFTDSESRKAFFQALSTAQSNNAGKMIFDYGGRKWFMDTGDFGKFRGNIYEAKGGRISKMNAASGLVAMASISFDRTEYVPGNGTPADPKRLRCHYEGEYGGWGAVYDSDSSDEDKGKGDPFRMTTFLK